MTIHRHRQYSEQNTERRRTKQGWATRIQKKTGNEPRCSQRMSNTDPPKHREWTHVLAKDEQHGSTKTPGMNPGVRKGVPAYHKTPVINSRYDIAETWQTTYPFIHLLSKCKTWQTTYPVINLLSKCKHDKQLIPSSTFFLSVKHDKQLIPSSTFFLSVIMTNNLSRHQPSF